MKMEDIRQLLRHYWWLPLISFYAMEILHETGHIIAGFFTGAKIESVDLLPWQFSRTAFSVNPHPGIVVWGGPLGGIVLALLLWALFHRWNDAHYLRFFAGFNLIANGLYIGIGCFGRVGDCAEMLKTGTPLLSMVLFGAAATVAGLFIWNGEAKRFSVSS